MDGTVIGLRPRTLKTEKELRTEDAFVDAASVGLVDSEVDKTDSTSGVLVASKLLVAVGLDVSTALTGLKGTSRDEKRVLRFLIPPPPEVPSSEG